MKLTTSLYYCFFYILLITGCQSDSFKYTSTDTGVLAELPDKKLEVQFYGPGIIRIKSIAATQVASERNSLVVIADPVKTDYHINENSEFLVLTTDSLKLSIHKKTGAVQFANRDNELLLTEDKSRYEADTLLGRDIFHVEQNFTIGKNEALYGLGQQQNGFMNLRGKELELFQNNQTAISPVLVSIKGYGIFWDNYSYTKYSSDTTNMRLWSEVGDCIDYYFIAGKDLDQVVSGYRKLTGTAPLYGKWAYGLFQSKEHYHTQEELLDVVSEYRKRNVPLDVIVQDWFYWEPEPWGSHFFDRERYPDPSGMIEEVHKQNAKIMISVWAKFEKGSPNFDEFRENGCLSEVMKKPAYNENMAYYDPYSSACREIYWKQIRDSLFNKGIDAWWLDATEPEMGFLKDQTTKELMNNSMGTGARYLNTFALMNSKGIYNAQREETDDKRVYILTRSAFAGQQRYAASTWSGDITASWDVFHKQIPAGLNFCYTGIPYWTTDIGAFFVPIAGGSNNPAYRELFVRWYQYGAFNPIFRVHGTHTPREIWQFGEPGSWAYDTQLKFNHLRHRLLPYIYSTAWQVSKNHSTIMRGLAFDYADDSKVWDIDDQFMFGNAFMVNPVTEPMYHQWYVPGAGVPIPAENFIDSEGQPGGLTGEYFDSKNLTNKEMTRRDANIKFDWGNNKPADNVSADNFSARWSGHLKPSQEGEYTIISSADDGARLWINNELVIDKWEIGNTKPHYTTLHLEQGKSYHIRYEYYEAEGDASVQLGWYPPGELEKEIDPLSPKYRNVYLPEGNGWYDFWTGTYYEGGEEIEADAPIEIMPLFVKAGSIVPMGSYVQYWNEKPAAPVYLRVYTGADADFTLYEDEGDNYNYEEGMFSEIPLKWFEKEEKMIIGDRRGSFPGMLKERTFYITWVGNNNGTGVAPETMPDKIVTYSGEKIEIKK